jgi:hypothetical protein
MFDDNEEEETFQDVYCDDDIKLDHIPDISECRKLRIEMKSRNFWPNVWHINERGNADLLSIGYNGAKIVKSWV